MAVNGCVASPVLNLVLHLQGPEVLSLGLALKGQLVIADHEEGDYSRSSNGPSTSTEP